MDQSFCQSTGSTVHALYAKVFGVLYSFTGFLKRTMLRVAVSSAVSSGGESGQRQRKKVGTLGSLLV